MGTSPKLALGSSKRRRRRRTKVGGSNNKQQEAHRHREKKIPFVFFRILAKKKIHTTIKLPSTYSHNHDAVVQESEADKGESVVQQN